MMGRIDIQTLLNKSIDILDIYEYQKMEIKKVEFSKLHDILNSLENDWQRAYFIGPKRTRNIYTLSMDTLLKYIYLN